MRVVVRNSKYAKRHLYGYHVPEFFTYEGEQVPAFKWAEPGTVCLTTGDPKFPVRAIYPDDIVSIDDAAIEQSEKPKAAEERVLLVSGSKGSTYTVTIGPRGKSCTCSGFQFRHNCRHINEALEAA